MTKNLFPIKGRYIVLLWILPFIYLPGLNYIDALIGDTVAWYWHGIAYYFYTHSLFIIVMLWLVYFYKINWRSMLGHVPRSEYFPAIKLTSYIFIFSIAAAYALFYPLSYLVPEFVKYWYIDLPPNIYILDGEYPIIPNILSFISIVIFAPVLEEFAFRGLLLHRWSTKWGMLKAVMVSSFIFGIAHPDPIGAMAFGVAMSVLYLKTQTLLLPIFCHAANNLVAWLVEAVVIINNGPDYVYTLDDFQNEWLVGMLSGLIVLIWTYLYIRGEKSQQRWHLPGLQETRE